jgi:predicted RNA binding protein YcfA (HicA-like mRNA interferase family)
MARRGWQVVSARGSHFKLASVASEEKIVVAIHSAIRRKAVLSALHEAGLTVEQFLEAL